MRLAAFENCMLVLTHYGISLPGGRTIDIGGTSTVYLRGEDGVQVLPNPLVAACPGLELLDKGFNTAAIGSEQDQQVDFLDAKIVDAQRNNFDRVFCFDTLEHVSNPFVFADHLIRIVKPGGFLYVSTIFNYVYHPSPDDFWRFTPEGLKQCFIDPSNTSRDQVQILWQGWETDGLGVALLAYKSGTETKNFPSPPVLPKFEKKKKTLGGRIQKKIKHWKAKLAGKKK